MFPNESRPIIDKENTPLSTNKIGIKNIDGESDTCGLFWLDHYFTNVIALYHPMEKIASLRYALLSESELVKP